MQHLLPEAWREFQSREDSAASPLDISNLLADVFHGVDVAVEGFEVLHQPQVAVLILDGKN